MSADDLPSAIRTKAVWKEMFSDRSRGVSDVAGRLGRGSQALGAAARSGSSSSRVAVVPGHRHRLPSFILGRGVQMVWHIQQAFLQISVSVSPF